jgi:hypothetical protein
MFQNPLLLEYNAFHIARWVRNNMPRGNKRQPNALLKGGGDVWNPHHRSLTRTVPIIAGDDMATTACLLPIAATIILLLL